MDRASKLSFPEFGPPPSTTRNSPALGFVCGYWETVPVKPPIAVLPVTARQGDGHVPVWPEPAASVELGRAGRAPTERITPRVAAEVGGAPVIDSADDRIACRFVGLPRRRQRDGHRGGKRGEGCLPFHSALRLAESDALRNAWPTPVAGRSQVAPGMRGRSPVAVLGKQGADRTSDKRDHHELQRREFHEALLETASFEDLPGKWQAAILEAEQNRPKLRLVTRDESAGERPKDG